MRPSPPLLLLDINVLLDVLLDRQPWSEQAARLLSLCDTKVVQGCWCSASVGTVYYLIRRELGARRARQVISDLLNILSVLPVDESVIVEAVNENWPDLEDAIVHASARRAGVTYLVTRNPKDYSKASIKVCDANSVLAVISALRVRGSKE